MSHFFSRIRSRWWWPLLVAATIFAASCRSKVAGPEVVNFDKVVHFAVYGLLATLVYRAQGQSRRAWLAVLLVSLFGVSDEWHQSFTPGREASGLDLVADTVGAALAVGLYARWGWYRRWLETPLRAQRRVETFGATAPNLSA